MNGTKKAPVWKAGLILAGLAFVCTALVAVTQSVTKPRIEANAQAYLEASLKPVLGAIEYDGILSESTLTIPQPHELPGKDAATVYRVYADSQPVAALFVVTAVDGFSGSIKLLIGIDKDGVLSGVRALEHRETPGLGDKIDLDKSEWILQFAAMSLNNPERSLWAIQRDGGDFDQFTGASITPRSVVNAVKQTLIFFEENRDLVFAPKAGEQGD